MKRSLTIAVIFSLLCISVAYTQNDSTAKIVWEFDTKG